MRISMLRLYGLTCILLVLSMIPSCSGKGGGGGGGGGEGGVAYTGSTSQAYITVANANMFFSLIWYGVPASVSMTPKPVIAQKIPQNTQAIATSRGVVGRLHGRLLSDRILAAPRSAASVHNTPVNETVDGSVSGTLTITGDIDPTTGTGSLTMNYANFNDGDGYTYDGTVVFKVDGYNIAYMIITDGTMSFSSWTIRSAGSDITIGGAMRMQTSIQNNNETLTINTNGRDNVSQSTYRFENFVFATFYNNIMYPTSASESLSGRVYDGAYGYVDVNTTAPFIYSSYQQENPNSGGPVVLSGAGNSQAAVTSISTNYAKIAVDADGDAVFEAKLAYAWNDLSGAPVELPPVANAGADQTVATGATVILNGNLSADPLGDPLTYVWTMTGAPGGSSAVLSRATSSITTFDVDLPGVYTVTLSVSNGKASSAPDTVAVTATGPPNSFLFRPYVAYAIGSWLEDVAIGDVTGDGKNDVVLVTSVYFDPDQDSHLFVFAQDAAGSLKTAVTYTLSDPYSNRPMSVAIGDINSDGNNEIVIGSDRSRIQIFAQDGEGGLISIATYTTWNSGWTKIADLNHDGRLDVVSMGWGTDSVDVFLQNVQGTLDPAVNYGVTHGGYDDLAVGDVNNDGLTDIIVMSGQGLTSAYPNIGILIQKTDGTFNSPVYYNVGENILTHGVSVGDINGDSLQDVVVSYGGNGPSANIGVFIQNNSGTLNSVAGYSSYDCPGPLAIADVNNDGRKDVLVVHGGWLTLGVYLQKDDGTLQPEEYYPIPYGSGAFDVDDINSDNALDVVIADRDKGLVVLYRK